MSYSGKCVGGPEDGKYRTTEGSAFEVVERRRFAFGLNGEELYSFKGHVYVWDVDRHQFNWKEPT